MSAKTTKTTNGAVALSGTGNAALDVFNLVRDTPISEIISKTIAVLNNDPADVVPLLFQLRDPRCGKGERYLFYITMLVLRTTQPELYEKILPHLTEIGCCVDYLKLTELAEAIGETKFPELAVVVRQLCDDMLSLSTDGIGLDEEKKEADVKISLMAKWAPTEGGSDHKFAVYIANLMFPDDKAPLKSYREAIGRLRRYLKVVERSMCLGEWDSINFSAVPAKAHKNLKGAFRKHQAERYADYLARLEEGRAKINSAGLMPHELVKEYLVQRKPEDATNEAQWRALVKELRQSGTFESSLAVVDVSGSMEGIPMEVAIALGLVVSELSAEPFRGRLLTFDANPVWHTVRGGSLRDRVMDVAGMPWGMNTDIEKVFKLILEHAKRHKVGAEAMPKTLYIFSDMQFDAARRGGDYITLHRKMERMFKEAGHELPSIVYWNLRAGTNNVPVSAHTPGVAMMSGFSSVMLKVFLKGDITTPLDTMNAALEPFRGIVEYSPKDIRPVPLDTDFTALYEAVEKVNKARKTKDATNEFRKSRLRKRKRERERKMSE